jgi:hypothetical protein
MTTFTQISNDRVIALFSCEQDPEYWPGVEEVADDDPRLIKYLEESSGPVVMVE